MTENSSSYIFHRINPSFEYCPVKSILLCLETLFPKQKQIYFRGDMFSLLPDKSFWVCLLSFGCFLFIFHPGTLPGVQQVLLLWKASDLCHVSFEAMSKRDQQLLAINKSIIHTCKPIILPFQQWYAWKMSAAFETSYVSKLFCAYCALSLLLCSWTSSTTVIKRNALNSVQHDLSFLSY